MVRKPIQISDRAALVGLSALMGALFVAGVSALLIGVYGWEQALRAGWTLLRSADGYAR